ncbi:Uncharacterized conserved protein YndB, AHSA1/START domain [Pseudarcicella hirudinis]|uniref:Uncharacterized conserved protein YndB, AHSA1/START domain n=1 Tax=Pseudarcicella hirudinis TaxID=1079859 RepID=A0A1I5MF10_9BACT|nr:SRPBCC domain-containing protein [Pseudarcicella hirudinis]SFP08172.1 Uncharacterized conserved protein YndB, AHSA1/START domain [Pseudarcicella hirudinis]
MEMDEWSSFTKRVTINAGIETILKAWCTQKGLESWFLRTALFRDSENELRNPDQFIAENDNYEWKWFGYPDYVQEGRVMSSKEENSLSFSFTENCLVTVKIMKENGENLVELTQKNIPFDINPKTNLYVACGEGWTFYLANLKSVLEGGIDLRNRNDLIQNVINA